MNVVETSITGKKATFNSTSTYDIDQLGQFDFQGNIQWHPVFFDGSD